MERCRFLKAVVLDWAGTTVDHGSRAPAKVFQEIFRRSGVEISIAQAREPMGMAKREHIAAVLNMPDVLHRWQMIHGQPASETDIDRMYEQFLPLQKETLHSGSDVIEGVPAAVQACRDMGLKIGSSTGYTRELMEILTPIARAQGYEPDCVLCAEDAPQGRPAPYLLYEAARRLQVYPLWAIVKVDDTPVGIEAGINAGCWTVGVTRSGNCVGLSAEECAALTEDEQTERCQAAERRLRAAGAHEIVASLAELPDVIARIDEAAVRGELPMTVRRPDDVDSVAGS